MTPVTDLPTNGQPERNQRAHFSKHAKTRLAERTRLTVTALARLLDEDRAASLGYHVGYRHWHRLIYSTPDRGYFVVVQDHRDGGVITIISLDNYIEHFGSVSEKRQRKALERSDLASMIPAKTVTADLSSLTPGIRLLVAVVTKEEKTFPIGTYAFTTKVSTEKDILTDAGFRAMLAAKMVELSLSSENLARIVVRRRRTRCLVLIELPHRDLAE